MALYRGENIDRFEAGRIGTAWTDKEETAIMFARGLNAVGKGGMVLQDLINELGRRLEYSVTNGIYQGTVKTIGFE